MCTVDDHSLCSQRADHSEAHVLVNETGFTRFSLTKCFLCHLHTLQEVDGIQEMAQGRVLAMPC